jgi:hypothetical protein
MKLIFSAFLAVVLCLFGVQAVAQDFDSKMSAIFQNVDKSQVSTGFLKDYGFEFLNPDHYTGNSLHDSNYVGLQDWRLLYATLLSCQVNSQASPAGLSSVNSQISTYNYGNMPLTFVSMDFGYDRLREDALNANLMYVSNDQLFDVPGRLESPYETASMFAIAPTHQQMLQGSNQIIFRPELFYSNNGKTVSDIAYNIGGGSSYTSIGFNTAANVTFDTTGWYTINIRVTYTDNTIRYGHTKVLVYSNPSYGQSSARFGITRFRSIETITATEQYQNVAGTVQLNIQLSVNNTTGSIRKPLIVVEGFDPNGQSDFDFLTGTMDVNASGFANTLNVQLDNIESYDLIFVNFTNGTDFIQRNALALEEAIKWVNDRKTNFNGVRQQNVIIGQSMGGLVTRWALRDMELDGKVHETRLFISHDAPHWGANVPASAQLGVQYLATWHVINGINGFPPVVTYADMFPQVNEGMAMFASPAARQMLIKRYVLNGNGYAEENSWHDAFMNELNGMGWPVNSRNILVSNGACNGTKAFADNSNFLTLGGTSGSLSYLQIIGTGFLSSLFGAINSTGIVFAGGNPQFNNWALLIDYPLSLITTKKTYTMDFRLNAVPSSGTGELFRAQIYNDRKILWVINARSYILNKVYSSFSGMLPLDNAPGGQFDFQARLNMNINQIAAGLPGYLNFIQPAINERRFCFVPTVSALAFNDPSSYLTASFCNNVPCLQTASVADYYAPTANEEHIQFTSGNGGWLLQRQDPTFSCAKVCPTGLSISGSSPVCTSSIFTLNNVPGSATVNWTTDSQWLGLSPSGASVTVTRPNGEGDGEFSLTAQVSNACNSVPAISTPTMLAGTPGLFGFPNFSNPAGNLGSLCSSHFGNTMELPYVEGVTYKYRILSYPSFNVVYTDWQTYAGGVITIYFTPQAGWNIVEIAVINACGTSEWFGYEVEYVDCNQHGNPEGMRVQVSPNPASTDLYLTLDDKQLAQTDKIECTLYSIAGSKIAKRWVLSAGQSRYQLNLAGVRPGQYVLVFNQGNKRIVKKIMIK